MMNILEKIWNRTQVMQSYKFKDTVSQEKISVSAYLHSIKIWIHY